MPSCSPDINSFVPLFPKIKSLIVPQYCTPSFPDLCSHVPQNWRATKLYPGRPTAESTRPDHAGAVLRKLQMSAMLAACVFFFFFCFCFDSTTISMTSYVDRVKADFKTWYRGSSQTSRGSEWLCLPTGTTTSHPLTIRVHM